MYETQNRIMLNILLLDVLEDIGLADERINYLEEKNEREILDIEYENYNTLLTRKKSIKYLIAQEEHTRSSSITEINIRRINPSNTMETIDVYASKKVSEKFRVS